MQSRKARLDAGRNGEPPGISEKRTQGKKERTIIIYTTRKKLGKTTMTEQNKNIEKCGNSRCPKGTIDEPDKAVEWKIPSYSTGSGGDTDEKFIRTCGRASCSRIMETRIRDFLHWPKKDRRYIRHICMTPPQVRSQEKDTHPSIRRPVVPSQDAQAYRKNPAQAMKEIIRTNNVGHEW